MASKKLKLETAITIQNMADKFDFTDKQIAALDLYVSTGGNVKEASRQLERDHTTIHGHLETIVSHVHNRGFHPELGLRGVMPEGQKLKGVSALYKKGEEEPVLTWYKTTNDSVDDISDAFINAFRAEIVLPKLPPKPLYTKKHLITEYIITDYHLGMLAWKGEGGANWDVEIAETMIVKWFAQAIAKSEPSEQAVFAQLGDFLHYDGLTPVTPANRHVLDADSRFPKVVEAALRIIRTVIEMLLKKHQKVTVILAEGNHDEASSIWLRKSFLIAYEHSDRVTIDDSNVPYYACKFGNVSLYYHHGHKKPMKALDVALTGMFSEIFGQTKYRYASCGHYHHSLKYESSLMHVEQYPTLAARDAYAARGGYLSHRSASVNTYHRDFGKVNTMTITPEMLEVNA